MDLVGHARKDQKWQALAGQGYAAADFKVDWVNRQATCPQGHTTQSWFNTSENGQPRVFIKFSRKHCVPCAVRHKCTRMKRRGLNFGPTHTIKLCSKPVTGITIKTQLSESRSGNSNLFLLDELFKGTNTVERIASGKAVLSYLNEGNNLTLVATHDLELGELLSGTFSLFHFSEIVEDGKIVFDYKIKPGNLNKTNAIRILELNDYPPEVITEATLLAGQIINSKMKNN